MLAAGKEGGQPQGAIGLAGVQSQPPLSPLLIGQMPPAHSDRQG